VSLGALIQLVGNWTVNDFMVATPRSCQCVPAIIVAVLASLIKGVTAMPPERVGGFFA